MHTGNPLRWRPRLAIAAFLIGSSVLAKPQALPLALGVLVASVAAVSAQEGFALADAGKEARRSLRGVATWAVVFGLVPAIAALGWMTLAHTLHAFFQEPVSFDIDYVFRRSMLASPGVGAGIGRRAPRRDRARDGHGSIRIHRPSCRRQRPSRVAVLLLRVARRTPASGSGSARRGDAGWPRCGIRLLPDLYALPQLRVRGLRLRSRLVVRPPRSALASTGHNAERVVSHRLRDRRRRTDGVSARRRRHGHHQGAAGQGLVERAVRSGQGCTGRGDRTGVGRDPHAVPVRREGRGVGLGIRALQLQRLGSGEPVRQPVGLVTHLEDGDLPPPDGAGDLLSTAAVRGGGDRPDVLRRVRPRQAASSDCCRASQECWPGATRRAWPSRPRGALCATTSCETPAGQARRQAEAWRRGYPLAAIKPWT